MTDPGERSNRRSKAALLIDREHKALVPFLQAVIEENDLLWGGVYFSLDQAMAGLARMPAEVVLLATGRTETTASAVVRRLKTDPAHASVRILLLNSPGGEDAEDVARALTSGALEAIPRPAREGFGPLSGFARLVSKALRKVTAGKPDLAGRSPARLAAPGKRRSLLGGRRPQLVAVGISTGGPQSLVEMMGDLEPDLPPLLIVQHIPEPFAVSLAQRLDTFTPLRVEVGREGQRMEPGHAYLAPGDAAHLVVRRDALGLALGWDRGPKVSGHKASVDALFDSLADLAVPCAAVLMTGMGADGARGMLRLREQGNPTAAQDEASCVVFGMPRAAYRSGATETLLPLGGIAAWINQACKTRNRRAG